MSINMKAPKKFILPVISIFLVSVAILGFLHWQSYMCMKKNYTAFQNVQEPKFVSQGVANDINQSWDHIEQGDEYFKSQNYQSAAEEFKMAYVTNYGSKSLSGLKLAESYEKLGRFNDAIDVLDQMIIKNQLSQTGVQMANNFKERLLAAKAQAGQAYRTQSGREALAD